MWRFDQKVFRTPRANIDVGELFGYLVEWVLRTRPKVISATSKRSVMGLRTFERTLGRYVEFERKNFSELGGDFPPGFDAAFLHNTVKVSDKILRRSIVYALQSLVNKIAARPDLIERMRRSPPLEIWCNTRSAVEALAQLGIPARVMYRPMPSFRLPDSYVPLPEEDIVLWYYKPEHKFMQPVLREIHELLQSIDDVQIRLFPSDQSPVDKPNVKALGRIDMAEWVPRVRGMVRVSGHLDFGRSTFEVIAGGRWVLYYDMPEEIVFSCPKLEEIHSSIRTLIATQDDAACRERYEQAKQFDLDVLSQKWRKRMTDLIRANRGPTPQKQGEAAHDTNIRDGAKAEQSAAAATYDKEFYNRQSEASYQSAKIVVPLIVSMFEIDSVCDVGCGVGTWLRAWQEEGIEDLLGIDGDYVSADQLRVAPSFFWCANLSVADPQIEAAIDGRRFSLATSFEVAEHLPNDRADGFVGLLTRASDRVIFSAAIPGQGGRGHVNERWASYWVSLFNANGFGCRDVIRPQIWHDGRVRYWYRQNMLVFEKGRENDKQLGAYDVVHPHAWKKKVLKKRPRRK